MYSSQRRVRETQAMQSWAKEELKDAKLARSGAEGTPIRVQASAGGEGGFY